MMNSKETQKVVADNGTEIELQSPQELAEVRADLEIEAGSKVRVLVDKPEHSQLRLGSIQEVERVLGPGTIAIKDSPRAPWHISPKYLEPVTPAEAAGYTVGDIFQLTVNRPAGTRWELGTKVVLKLDDGSRVPLFARLSDGLELWLGLASVEKVGDVPVESPKEESVLKTIQYEPEAERSIRVGVPFTWGTQVNWYIKAADSTIVRLSDGHVYTREESHILSRDNLKYATNMELR